MPQQKSSELKATIAQASSRLHMLDADAQRTKASPDSWSNQEILGHLIDSAYNNHRRFVLAADQDNLIFDGYPQDLWVKANNYNQSEWSTLVNTWTTANNHLADLIKNLPEQLVRRPTTNHNFNEIGFRAIEKGAPSSLDFLIEDYIAHLQHHLKQLLP